MYWITLIIVGLLMGWAVKSWLAQEKTLKGEPWLRLLITIIGAWLGDAILGDWGWMLAGFNVFAGIIGSFVLGWIWTLVGVDEEAGSSANAR
jgi:uncharacterized membrane protein YeaQ/YmgE (transglycosylase-associated protein family)